MHRILYSLAFLGVLAMLPLQAIRPQTGKQVLRYQGTIGQRHAGLTLEFEAGSLSAAHYQIDQQAGEIAASELRLIGTTIVMADDDGNLFHLHLEDSGGHTASGFHHADLLEGTMVRGEDVDLAVKLGRVDKTNGKE
jgi:hypothetical protein